MRGGFKMRPEARLSAAIEILDRVLEGQSAETALTGWGRSNRFAGSGDRAALRDLVFDALRCKRSYAALGGAMTGRGLILGGMRERGEAVEAMFTGIGHAPPVLGPADAERAPLPNEALDCPDWLAPALQASLQTDFTAVMQAMRQRAPLYLRVNPARATIAQALESLAVAGIVAQPVNSVNYALEVTENARKIQTSAAYLSGAVELQDAASQAVIEALPLRDGLRVLDYCAGGGGKTLAMAARARLQIFAHDIAPRRMADLPARAERAGVSVQILESGDISAPYDLILTDAPCSGSGSWRRDPQGKWALTAKRLGELVQVQAEILDRVAPMVAPEGVLAYVTCSMLRVENEDQVKAFLGRNARFSLLRQLNFTPLQGGDGFFLAILQRNE